MFPPCEENKDSLSQQVDEASQYDYHSLGSLKLHGQDIIQGDLLEVQLDKSHTGLVMLFMQ